MESSVSSSHSVYRNSGSGHSENHNDCGKNVKRDFHAVSAPSALGSASAGEEVRVAREPLEHAGLGVIAVINFADLAVAIDQKEIGPMYNRTVGVRGCGRDSHPVGNRV